MAVVTCNMNEESQKEQIKNSLQAIVEACKKCNANYRILGSVQLVAYTKKIFRHINDLDVLLDIRQKECVFKELQKEGFEFEKRSKVGLPWMEAKKEGCLALTFLMIGEFLDDYFTLRFLKVCELRTRADYLKPTEYDYEGVKFIGIPLSSAIAGIRKSFLNPKRRFDRQVLGDEMKRHNVKTYDNTYFYIAGVKIPFLYDMFSFLYNIYGGLRVVFGRKWEVWDVN